LEAETMSAIMTKTVGELAAENPAATRVFEKLGIDYCCGGSDTLGQACRAAGLALETVKYSMEVELETGRAAAQDRDWRTEPLADLIAHIRNTHHQYTRAALARLGPLFDKVCSVHGNNHPELARMRATFGDLAQELATHLMKEEMVLFPYIVRMEEAVLEKSTVLPAPFGSVRNPVAMMLHEHDGAGQALREMRAAGSGYVAPPDACASYQSLYQTLAEFETDLHQHIHLENNILFPRAIEMERGIQARP
jgi:regulator of cell morphogenesis and NO signaling